LAWLFRDSNANDLCDRLVDELRLQPIIDWFEGSEIWDAVFAHHGRPWKVKPSFPLANTIKPAEILAKRAGTHS
jgi:hypothetical protein